MLSYTQVLALFLLAAPAAMAFQTPKPLTTTAPKTESKPTSTTLFGDGSWYTGPYTPSYGYGGGYGRRGSYYNDYDRGYYNNYYDNDYYGNDYYDNDYYGSYGYGRGGSLFNRRYNDYDRGYYYDTRGRYSSWRPAYRGPLAPDNFDYSSDTVGGRRLFDNDNRYRVSRDGMYYSDSPYYSRSGRNYYDNFARNSNYYGDRGMYNYNDRYYSGYGSGGRYGNRYGNYYINDYDRYSTRYNRLGAYAYSE